MKKAVVAVMMCLLMVFAVNVYAEQEHAIKSNSFFGCTDKEQFKKIFKCLIEKDMQAFKQGLSAGIVNGQCILFNAGDPVYLVETSIFSGMIKIRPKGSMTEYWTNIEAINQ